MHTYNCQNSSRSGWKVGASSWGISTARDSVRHAHSLNVLLHTLRACHASAKKLLRRHFKVLYEMAFLFEIFHQKGRLTVQAHRLFVRHVAHSEPEFLCFGSSLVLCRARAQVLVGRQALVWRVHESSVAEVSARDA